MTLPFVVALKRDAMDDGPGIRTVVFFKGCSLSCAWCHNPESLHPLPQPVWRAERCLGCGLCLEECRSGAIEGLPGPSDPARCTRCGACAQECPSTARELVGRQYPADELVALLLRDERLYHHSGGGVTFSGGEPALHAPFVATVARALRARGVHVLLQTAGNVEARAFEEHLVGNIDTFFFDLKLLDRYLHQLWCGRDNARILDNLERLLARGDAIELLVRVALVPGVTATDENLAAAAAWLRARGATRVALLPYNPLWIPKARAVGRAVADLPATWMSDAELARAHAHFAGFEVVGAHAAPVPPPRG